MTELSPNHILYPVFAMFVLVAIVLLRMRSMRFAAVRNKAVKAGYYRVYRGETEPEELAAISRNFSNLFEMPVLFYVGVLMTYVTHQVNLWLVVCAWVYVTLRYAHTLVHLTSNNVIVRFSIYFTSGFVLLVMWASLFVQLVRTG